jgi:hypothetical protein
MYLRERNSNISIEKAIYLPAQKNEQGAVVKPAVRSTKYLGSIHRWTRFNNVPRKILDELSAEEHSELQKALAKNEPKDLAELDALPLQLANASRDLKDCVAKHGIEEAKKILESRLKAADGAWAAFFKTAQTIGLKRKSRQAAATKPAQPEVKKPGD